MGLAILSPGFKGRRKKKMTVNEAIGITGKYGGKSVLTPDEEHMMIEALEFLISETKQTKWMVWLGGYYYGRRNFDLALKYYEMAYDFGDTWAPEGLGYIWYYGRTGTVDYEKAFRYYSEAAENGIVQSKMKLADMYKNGYFVEKDYDKYRDLIEDLYLEVRDDYDLPARNDILFRLGRIRVRQGRKDEAADLFLDARRGLAQVLIYDQFFGNLNVMKWLTDDYHELIPINPEGFDLYDLYYLMKEPVKISFWYKEKEYIVEAVEKEGGISIKFDGKWYRDIDEFFMKATIDGCLLPELYYFLCMFRIK